MYRTRQEKALRSERAFLAPAPAPLIAQQGGSPALRAHRELQVVVQR
jgi:hypothetical protein